eukprot:TRINITY_DN2856_c0_g1_i1.p1 TRINITY_DN2856_c0_g1~~TRINITY_DN2856_c0_g1_i1.p1  ORF type:complete len:874 (+),score=141.65 TRINITY_DN2856_c0_g1_i1:216-2837(+)
MRTFSGVRIVYVFAMVLNDAEGDLPVHCLQPQVLGIWRIHVGRLLDKHGDNATTGDGDRRCGYNAPDKPDAHHHLTPPTRAASSVEADTDDGYFLTTQFQEMLSFEVELRDWTAEARGMSQSEVLDTSRSDSWKGSWTMIYDEGMEIALANDEGHSNSSDLSPSPGPRVTHSFFAFFKYKVGGNPEVASRSNCSYTLLGWYKRLEKLTSGPSDVRRELCWWGEHVSTLTDHSMFASPLVGKGSAEATSTVRATAIPQAPLQSRESASSSSSSSSSLSPSKLPARVREQGEDQFKRNVVIFLFGCSALLAFDGTVRSPFVTAELSKRKASGWRVIAIVLQRMIVGSELLMTILALCGIVVIHFKGVGCLKFAPLTTRHFMSINDLALQTEGQLADVRRSGGHARWEADPSKLSAWVAERSKRLGLDVTEHSEVERLLDLVGSRPVVPGLVGFETYESIGPAQAAAQDEQTRLARLLHKEPHQLSMENLHEMWGTSAVANHHVGGRFSLDGDILGPDDWKHLADFDWRRVSLRTEDYSVTGFVPPVVDQGICGSCYAVAPTSMFTARLLIRYPALRRRWRRDDRISVQQQLSCNHYVQGCNGGYPYLVSKWSSENTLFSDKCFKALGTFSNSTCGIGAATPEHPGVKEACQERYRVENFRYIGGSYGRCGFRGLCEQAIREEIYRGGPVAVALQMSAQASLYTGGILHELSPHSSSNNMKTSSTLFPGCNATDCFTWEALDHSALIVGWGEDITHGQTCQSLHQEVDEECVEQVTEEGCREKHEELGCVWQGFRYWVVQNSYGENWGSEGYLYVGPRGRDPLMIESMSSAADVVMMSGTTEHDSVSKAADWNHSPMLRFEKLSRRTARDRFLSPR